MEEWKTYSIGEICKVLAGGDASKYACVKEADESHQVPVYANATDNEGLYGYTTSPAVTSAAVTIAARGAGIGFTCYRKSPFVPIVRLITLLPITDTVVDVKYLYYYLKLNQIKGDGSAIPQITVPQVKKKNVVLPSIEQQRQIVDILNSIDDKIELNNRINHNLEQQAQALFNNWITECEERVAISDLCNNILDYSPYTDERVYALNSSDVTEGVFADLPYSLTCEIKGQFKKRFQQGDILYSEIRPRNLHYAYCYFNPSNYLASTRLMVIRTKPEMLYSSVLLYQYLQMPIVFKEFTMKTESRSGTFPQGNFKDLASSVVPYSNNNKEISIMLDLLYNNIWQNFEENKILSSLRDMLLPKLMSGELKINDVTC